MHVMSRRGEPSAAAQNAAKNQAIIKGLLKKEPNKICADCKRNKRKCTISSASQYKGNPWTVTKDSLAFRS